MNESIFDGDGRTNVYPKDALQSMQFFGDRGVHPRHSKVTRATARLITRAFDAKGESNHSGQGAHVWVVVQHLLEQRRHFEVFGVEGEGFMVRALGSQRPAPADVPLLAKN